MSFIINPYNVIPGTSGDTVVFLGRYPINSSTSTITQNNANIDVAGQRRIVSVIAGYMTNGFSSLTINGNAATTHMTPTVPSTGGPGVAIASLEVLSGTTANLVWNFGGGSTKNLILANYAIYGPSTPAVVDTAVGEGASTSTTRILSIDTTAGGIIIGGYFCGSASGGLTVDTDNYEESWVSSNHFGCFWEETPSTASNSSVTITRPNTTNAYYNAAAVSFK